MKGKKTVIIQARTGSKRLASKVLMNVENKPLICHVIDRIKKTSLTDQIILATSNNSDDQILLKIADDENIIGFAGNENDVLDRFYHAGLKHNAELIIRITADCPLIDPSLVDKMIEFYDKHDYDYVSNTVERTFPDGLDVEIFSFPVLEKTYTQAKWSSEREHVTPYIIKNNGLFKIFNYKNEIDLSHLRWCVDEKIDLVMIQKIFQEMRPKTFFTTDDVLNLLSKKQDISKINSKIQTNQGYLNSLKNDKIVK
tara:strand:- start:1930 stop:2694 length:765 start_codon:yes stop_codon:yes gene_type:complete